MESSILRMEHWTSKLRTKCESAIVPSSVLVSPSSSLQFWTLPVILLSVTTDHLDIIDLPTTGSSGFFMISPNKDHEGSIESAIGELTHNTRRALDVMACL
jgi:hypothetical protein